MSMTAFQPFGDSSSARQTKFPAAVFTRISTHPNVPMACAIMLSTCSGSRTSTWKVLACWPARSSAARPASRCSVLRLAITTRAPTLARLLAIASPIPVPPPVTIATWSFRSSASNMRERISAGCYNPRDGSATSCVTRRECMPRDQNIPTRRRRQPSPEAYQRLFEAVHEGVYIGRIAPEFSTTETIAANAHLRLMFGYAADASDAPSPFDVERFTDAEARQAFFSRLERDQAVTDYLLRLKRADGSPMWVEVTAHAEADRERGGLRVEA